MVKLRQVEVNLDDIVIGYILFDMIFERFKQLGFAATSNSRDDLNIRSSDYVYKLEFNDNGEALKRINSVFEMPEIIAKPINYIASLNTPVAMLIFGTYIANTDFRSIFKNWRIFAVALVKLIILPLLLIAAFRLVGITGALVFFAMGFFIYIGKKGNKYEKNSYLYR